MFILSVAKDEYFDTSEFWSWRDCPDFCGKWGQEISSSKNAIENVILHFRNAKYVANILVKYVVITLIKIMMLDVGWSNKGNLALVNSTVETIKRYNQDTEFVFMGPLIISKKDFHVEKQAEFLSLRDFGHSLNSFINLGKCMYIYIFKKLFKLDISVSRSSVLWNYYNSDIVISSGGDSMSGEGGIGVMNTLMNILYAILLGKPVVLYGCSIGYYKNRFIRSFAINIFNRTELILVREELSKKYLEEHNINKPKIYFTADPAFALNPAQETRVLEILSDEGYGKLQRPIIGINTSGLIGRFKGEGQETENDIARILARVIDDLIEQLNATIIMIPHVYCINDDRKAIKLTLDNVKNRKKVVAINGEYTPQELKGIIGQCDLFVGARMHATIASTSMLVPTVGIAYSHKMHGIIGNMLCQEKYVIDIKDLDYKILAFKINEAWKNRENIRNKLEVEIPLLKEKALSNGRFVKDLIDALKLS